MRLAAVSKPVQALRRIVTQYTSGAHAQARPHARAAWRHADLLV